MERASHRMKYDRAAATSSYKPLRFRRNKEIASEIRGRHVMRSVKRNIEREVGRKAAIRKERNKKRRKMVQIKWERDQVKETKRWNRDLA